jgi:amino acid adenylation domain-containing protein
MNIMPDLPGDVSPDNTQQRRDETELFPLTQGQLSFWLAQMLDLNDPAFNIGECVEILGTIDPARFELALRQVVEITDALHLQILETENGPRQYFKFQPGWTLIHRDFSTLADPDAAAAAWMQADMARAFRMDGAPLYRFALLKISDDRYFWYAVNHHLVNDGVGWRLVLRRVAEAYTTVMKGFSPLIETGGSWRDIIAEEAAYKTSDHYQRDRTFWRTQLADLPPRVTLSGKPARKPLGFIKTVGWIPQSLDLDDAAHRYGTSAAAILVAATGIYLHRVTGAKDMMLAMPVGARVGPKMRSIVGMAANAVPLRLSISPEDRIDDIVQRAAQGIRGAMRHQRYRLEDMRRDLGLGPRDGEIAGTLVNFTPLDDGITFDDAKILRNPLGNWWVEDLQIVFYGGQHPSGLRLDFIANSAHYSERDVAEHCNRFIATLADVASRSADDPVSSVRGPAALLTTGEQDRLPQGSSETKSNQHERRSAPPCTATEISLADIWRDILHSGAIHRGDDFFDIGGDSLLANLLMTRVRKIFQLDLPLGAVFEAPTLDALARRIDAAVHAKGRSLQSPALRQVADDEPAPLSFSQHRMWLIQSLDPGNSAYNMSGATRLIGRLDVAALSQAINALRRRHEILRTTYEIADEKAVQRVQAWLPEPLRIIDLTEFEDPVAEAVRRANDIAAAPIGLSAGPIFSCVLMRIGADDHVIQTTVHHIAGDQWSFGILGRELAALYNAARKGHVLNLPPPEVSYRDYARWQQGWLDSPEMAGHLEYWRQTLKNVPALELPTDRPRPRIQTLKGSYCVGNIPANLIERLEQLGRRASTTVFMTMFAGFAVLLHRLSNQIDLAVGVPVANRTHSDVENVVGTFVNTLALRVDLSGDPTFKDLLGRIRTATLDAFAHQDVPFDKIVQETLSTRDTSRPPLVQVMFNMLNAPMHGIDLDGVTWEPVFIDRQGAQFELSMSIDCQITRTVTVEYNSDLFERATVERFIARYLRLLESAVAAPDQKISEVDILPSSERQLVLETWNATGVSDPHPPFIAMFEDRAAQSPDAPAVTFQGATLTYGELNARADVLARELSRLSAGRGSAIGICLPRSLDMLIALLAVQKSGGAYVPLDPKLPQQRLEYMIADSGIDLVIAVDDVIRTFGLPPNVRVVAPDASLPEHALTSEAAGRATSSDPAYIIYTSGSTGKPKAVAVSHGALSNLLGSMQKEPGISATDVMAAVTTISFDIAGLELYLPLLAGARIELIAPETSVDAYALMQSLAASGATLMQATPATWRMLVDAGWNGGPRFRALCGGETLRPELAHLLLTRTGELWNLYGPTETTIWSTVARIHTGDDPISIGKPIANTRVYILDGNTPAPIGVTGEICIGGDGVAIGYHRQPELTAARFQSDPFAKDDAARMYRTGDLGYWGKDGRLYHLGRMDQQVKVRGFRIEPGEIETVLRAHSAVRETVIVARDAGPSDTRLIAYVVYASAQEPTTSDMRRYLRQRLPDYMVPSLIVSIDRLPLTPNGKIDRNALPDPFAGAAQSSRDTDEPAPGRETLVADIWREMLKIGRVNADDNFFDLGGHSLLALRAVAQIERRTGIRLDPRVLFFQSLRQIAANLPEAGDWAR